jgi:hypothetical protein
MRKLFILVFILSFISAEIFSQDFECVSCYHNNVDFTKYASAIGSANGATGSYSFVGGFRSQATGDYSFAFGSNCTLPMGNGFLIGNKLMALTDNAFIIGDGGMDTTLSNNVSYSLNVGFNSNLPTLHVGPSIGPGRTGKIGIGNVTAPEAKLHIRADAVEHAIVRIENTGSDKLAGIVFGNGSQSITTSQSAPFTFNSGQNDYYFENGNVGIGTNEPDAKVHVKDGDIFIEDIDRGIIMKSPDGNCWRGTVNNQGQMQFTQMDCQSLETDIEKPEPSYNEGVKIYPNPAGNKVMVEIPDEYIGAQLSIKSSDGKTMRTSRLSKTQNSVDLSSYTAGIYFFYLTLKGELLEVKKVVKE